MIIGRSYAKINLCLDITGTAANGMHMVDMVMQSISLHDTITVEKAGTLSVTAENMTLPAQNTFTKAAGLFFEHTGIAQKARIHVLKRIPARAGLGGGSSNGAATLRMLDRLFHTGLDEATLLGMAKEIGSDAPFFLTGGCMRAADIGTRLSPVKNQCAMNFLLIKPADGVSTKAAYDLYDTLPQAAHSADSVIRALSAGNCAEYYNAAKNALTEAGGILCPEIPEILSDCKKKGADFALMTGSGSCVFAVFENKALFENAHTHFRSRYPFVAQATPTGSGMEF
jgi:4-diphosphocytidyl-2-C-methyl-D-erythritol kinase